MAKPSREIEVPKIASQSGDPGLYEVLRDIVKRTSAYVNDLIDTHRHVPGDIDNLTAASVENVPAGTISSTNVQDAINELDTAISAIAFVPTGTIAMWSSAAAPSGWLLCDGSWVPQTTYAALYAIVGSTFWGGGAPVSGSFQLPDMRQRFPLGKAAAGTGSTLGGTGGAIDHTHSFSATTATALASAMVTNSSYDVDVSRDGHEHSVSGTTGTNNPPFQAVNFIIKT